MPDRLIKCLRIIAIVAALLNASLLKAALLKAATTTSTMAADAGRFAKWSKIELAFEGPTSRGIGRPNPFAVRFDVNFTGPRGKRYCVPGFYDGDGKGGLNGAVWKVRFSADELGRWT